MRKLRVHATVAAETQKVQLVTLRLLHGVLESRIRVKLARADHQVDTGDVHVDDASRTHVHVADLAVAHLPLGQPDIRARRVDQRVRVTGKQVIVGRLACQGNGVTFRYG